MGLVTDTAGSKARPATVATAATSGVGGVMLCSATPDLSLLATRAFARAMCRGVGCVYTIPLLSKLGEEERLGCKLYGSVGREMRVVLWLVEG